VERGLVDFRGDDLWTVLAILNAVDNTGFVKLVKDMKSFWVASHWFLAAGIEDKVSAGAIATKERTMNALALGALGISMWELLSCCLEAARASSRFFFLHSAAQFTLTGGI
jgi:hypothetical protein